MNVHSNEQQRAAPGDETLQGRNDVVTSDGTVNVHRQGFSGVFVHDVQQFQASQIGGLAELEIESLTTLIEIPQT